MKKSRPRRTGLVSRLFGHSPTINDTVYKKRETTKTTLDLLTQSSNQAIPLQSAVAMAQQLGCIDDKSVKLLAD
jgi:hypothetical protein